LGEVVGTESKGLSADTISSLPSVTYHAQDKQEGNMEQYVLHFVTSCPHPKKTYLCSE
jgi:E3 ubiquitin-protein ligase BIG BROTHER-like protein